MALAHAAQATEAAESVRRRLGPGYGTRAAARRWQQLREANRTEANPAAARTTPPVSEDIVQALVAAYEHASKPATASAQPVSQLEQATTDRTASEATAQPPSPKTPGPPATPSAWSTIEEPAGRFAFEAWKALLGGGVVAALTDTAVYLLTYPSRPCPGQTLDPREPPGCNAFLQPLPFPASTAKLIFWSLVAVTALVAAGVLVKARSASRR